MTREHIPKFVKLAGCMRSQIHALGGRDARAKFASVAAGIRGSRGLRLMMWRQGRWWIARTIAASRRWPCEPLSPANHKVAQVKLLSNVSYGGMPVRIVLRAMFQLTGLPIYL
jgi:hypothetical protein